MSDEPAPSLLPAETPEQLFSRLSDEARERMLNALARYLLEEEQRQATLQRLRKIS